MREIVGQEFETDDEDAPRARARRRSRQIISAHDPEMRHGRKTNAPPFTGYKLHVAAAADVPVLTAIAISPGNEHDGQHAGALVDQQPEPRRPTRVIGDTAYGNVEVREQLEQRSIACSRRCTAPLGKRRHVPKDEFQIDLDNDTVTCPQGKTAPIYKTSRQHPATGERVARFARTDCEPCPLRARCALAAAATSASAAAKTSAKPRCAPYRPRRARAPQAHQATHRTTTRTDRLPLPRPHTAATSAAENRPSKPSGPPPWSTCTRSEPPSEPRRHNAGRLDPGEHATDTPPGAQTRIRPTPFLSGLAQDQHSGCSLPHRRAKPAALAPPAPALPTARPEGSRLEAWRSSLSAALAACSATRGRLARFR